jgi:hypothetical protein
VQVRIVRRTQRFIDGIDTSTLKQGEVYDLTSIVGNVLIAEGVAMLEMRRGERRQSSTAASRALAHDRRTSRRRS